MVAIRVIIVRRETFTTNLRAGCRRLIGEPDQLARRVYPRRGQPAAARADCFQDRGLGISGYQKGDMSAAFDRRIGQGQADLWAAVRDRRDPSLALLQHWLPR